MEIRSPDALCATVPFFPSPARGLSLPSRRSFDWACSNHLTWYYIITHSNAYTEQVDYKIWRQTNERTSRQSQWLLMVAVYTHQSSPGASGKLNSFTFPRKFYTTDHFHAFLMPSRTPRDKVLSYSYLYRHRVCSNNPMTFNFKPTLMGVSSAV